MKLDECESNSNQLYYYAEQKKAEYFLSKQKNQTLHFQKHWTEKQKSTAYHSERNKHVYNVYTNETIIFTFSLTKVHIANKSFIHSYVFEALLL